MSASLIRLYLLHGGLRARTPLSSNPPPLPSHSKLWNSAADCNGHMIIEWRVV